MKYFLGLMILVGSFSSTIYSQNISLKGVIRDSTDRSRLISAVVSLKDVYGKQKTFFTTSEKNGSFRFENLPAGTFLMEISYMGYKNYADTLRLIQSVDMGNVFLSRSIVRLNTQVEVIGHVIPAEQKEDTVEYTAKAFKTEVNADAEALVTKIPGVQREDGVLKAQGEEVKQVLVDGKPFFGEDPTVTLKNLPAEIIDKIQVFDKMSDQSQFTGFDDGNSTKAINIITRSDRRNGQFGKLYGGYGSDDRFQSGGSINFFKPERKFSVIGLGNNINQQNFSQQDILGLTNSSGGGNRSGMPAGMQGGQRGGRGGNSGGGNRGGGDANNFLVGSQDGNTNTYSTGLNFTDNSVKDLTVNLSYFFNNAKNTTDQLLDRQYFSTQGVNQYYNETSNYTSNNFNHRINGKVEYAFDSLNSFVLTPRIYFQKNNSSSYLSGSNTLPENVPLSSTINSKATDVDGYNVSNELLFRHKMALPGRTLSLGATIGLNFKKVHGDVLSISEYIQNTNSLIDTLDEQTNQDVNGRNISANLNYTEPIGTESQLQISSSVSLKRNISDKKVDSLNTETGMYDLFDALHSNTYQNDYTTIRGGVSYRWHSEPYSLTIGGDYQKSKLAGDQTFPTISKIDKTFENFLPEARIMYRASKSNFFRFSYNTNVNAPSIDQLQNVIDNSNTLQLKTGNPNLKAEYNHRIMTQYISTNISSGTSFFAMLFAGYTMNNIGNVTISALKDTTLPNGVFLNSGSQLTYPVNLDNALQLRAFINNGFMIEDIRSTMNFNTSINYTRTPGLINNVTNISKTVAAGLGVMLTSNISEDIDYRISYTPTYNNTLNDVQKSLDNNYFIHTANATFYWMFYGNLFVRNDFTYYYNTGLSAGVQQKYYLWNAAIGLKLFEKNTGEIKLEVFDILNQNKSLSKTVTDTYIEDKNTQVLKQYFLLTFTYNLKRFGG